MAYSSTTTYLGLKDITLNDESWLVDSRYNNQKLDVIGKHLRTQSSDGSSLALRYALTSGILVDVLSVTSSGTALTVGIGRSGDTIQAGARNVARWLGNLAAAPTSNIGDGDLYFDTVLGHVYIRANSTWKQLTN